MSDDKHPHWHPRKKLSKHKNKPPPIEPSPLEYDQPAHDREIIERITRKEKKVEL